MRFQICATNIHAVESMLHWPVRKIFCLNWIQIPQCDSWTCAPVTTLLKSYFPTIVTDNCKQAKLLLLKHDAGQGEENKPILSGSHWSVLCTCVCIVTGLFRILKVDEKHPNRHVTAAVVSSLPQEYTRCADTLERDVRTTAHPFQVGSGLKSVYVCH